MKANVIFFDNREASKNPWTKEVWYYDYRTNIHHTLKKKPLRFEDLAEFVACYNPKNRHKRKATWEREEPRRPLAQVHLRGTARPRQDQPRHLLAQGQEPHRPRQPAGAGRARRGDHREPGGGSREPRSVLTALRAPA